MVLVFFNVCVRVFFGLCEGLGGFQCLCAGFVGFRDCLGGFQCLCAGFVVSREVVGCFNVCVWVSFGFVMV